MESGLTELRMKQDRLGHLNLSDVHQVVASMERCSEQLTDADCLSLLQYCCRMAEEEYRPCGSLVQRVWALTTHRKSGQLTLEHLELYLHLCLAVESTSMSKKDIFDVMEEHQLEPSAGVFEDLMMALGQRGHLTEALQVLAAMKERDVPVREATFAALILAYGADRDWEGVQGVLDAMKSVQVALSEVTFGALASVFAMLGQMVRLKQVVSQASEEGKPLSSGQLEAVLMALIHANNAGDQFKNIDLMLRLVEECGMKVDVSRMALRLIHRGHVREAVHLFLSLPALRTNNHLYSNASVYLREIVHARMDPALIVEVCQRLREEDINHYALQVALEYALKGRWEELAWVLLRAMKEAGEPLREHYFWPLLHLKTINLEPAKLLGCVEAMLELGETPCFETLRDHIIPGLSLSQPRLTLQMLQNTGLSATAAATPLLVVLVKNNMMEHALKFAKETNAPLNLRDIIGTLAPAWHSNTKSIVTLLALLIHRQQKEALSVNEYDWGGQFLLSLAATRAGLAVHHIRPLFQEMKKQRIGVSEHSADLLMNRLSLPLQEAVRASLPLVLRAELGCPPLEMNNHIPHPRNMSAVQLEGHLEELRAKGLNTRGSLRRLLLQRAAKNDTAGVMELMKSASEEGQEMSPGMLSGVLGAYVSQGHTQAAVDMFGRLRTEHPAFTLDSYKVVDLCTLLTQNGRVAEAMDILENYIMECSGGKKIDPKNIRRNCQNLLLASASRGDPKETEKLLELLVLGGLAVPNNLSLGALVKSRLLGGDLKGAVEEARRIYERYKCLPMRLELLIHLINNYHNAASESESVASCQLLDDMLGLIAEVRGSVSARHDLFFAHVEGGRPVGAGKVLKNLGRELDRRRVKSQLEYYVKTENEAAMVNFLSASRGVGAIDRQAAYSALLNIYYVQSEGEKGLSLWTAMQEEGLTASPAFLSTLAALLTACEMKIPFQV